MALHQLLITFENKYLLEFGTATQLSQGVVGTIEK